jgi:hypothetical protein
MIETTLAVGVYAPDNKAPPISFCCTCLVALHSICTVDFPFMRGGAVEKPCFVHAMYQLEEESLIQQICIASKIVL